MNFDLRDVFDQLFVYGSSHSCCVRDTFQGTLRVRHIKEDVMYAYIYQRSVNRRLPLKEVDVRKEIQDLVITKEMVLQHMEPSKLTFVEYEPESRISSNPPVLQENTLKRAIGNLPKPIPNYRILQLQLVLQLSRLQQLLQLLRLFLVILLLQLPRLFLLY